MKRLGLILGLFFIFFSVTVPVKAQGLDLNRDNLCVGKSVLNLCPTCFLSCVVNGEEFRCDTQSACIAKQQEAAGSAGSTSTGGNIAPGSAACRFITNDEQDECAACFDDGGAWTALGCLGEGGKPSDFVQSIIRLGIGMGGGLAFLLILLAGFQTITSTGNPERLHAARELMGAAISGLLLIIFSVFLLRFIGVDILGLPTFFTGGTGMGPR